jgi:hypothetical protein
MNFDKNKKLIALGVLVVGFAVFMFLQSKKKKNETLTPADAPPILRNNYTVTLGSVDPTGAVFVILDGKKYPFVSEKAFVNYGYKVPDVITKEELDSFTTGGFVSEDGKVIKSV